MKGQPCIRYQTKFCQNPHECGNCGVEREYQLERFNDMTDEILSGKMDEEALRTHKEVAEKLTEMGCKTVMETHQALKAILSTSKKLWELHLNGRMN